MKDKTLKATQIVIRKYQPADTNILVSLWQEANALAHPFLPDDFVAQVAKDMRNIYLPKAETWVLINAGQPVGFIALLGDEIGGLFLKPSEHGKGLGRKMVDHAVDLKGPLRVEVFKNNFIGRRFYDSYGFKYVEEYTHESTSEVTIKMEMQSN